MTAGAADAHDPGKEERRDSPLRILIDATAVGEGRGGIITYLQGLLRGWNEAGLPDEFAVVGTRKLPSEIDDTLGERGTVFRLDGTYPGSRFITQHVGIPALARRWKPDVVLATTPVVPLLLWRRPVVAMVHDLRHRHRPAEFGRVQRLYRNAMYRIGFSRTKRVLSNSLLTERDVAAAYPRIARKIETVYLGCDQFGRDDETPGSGKHALAHAHWTNKQPDVSIRTWGVLRSTIPGFDCPLHIVGVRPEDRRPLQDLTDRCGVSGLVQLHDYLDDTAYRRLFASARLLLMPSTFEGFGLPVVEAMRLGVAVVASDNAGMQEAGGACALYAPAHDPEAFAQQCARVLFDDEFYRSLVEDGLRHSATFTWRRTAEGTRNVLTDAVKPRSGTGQGSMVIRDDMAPTVDRDGLQSLLVCPCCRGPLSWATEAVCADCGGVYPIIDGIPVLLPNPTPSPADAAGLTTHKQVQIDYYDHEPDPEFEITRPHGTARLYQWLLGEKFRRSLAGLGNSLGGRTALTVCGGSGMDAEYLARAGAVVVASDLSLGAAQRTRERACRYGLAILPIVADIEHLPFADRAVDLVYVHDGLHHLEKPEVGLAAMSRVAAWGVSVTEPADAAGTAVAARIGLAQRVEEAGNRVERLSIAAVAAELRRSGFAIVHTERYAMYYKHRPGPVFAALSLPWVFPLTRFGWTAANALLGRVGNKLTAQAVRPSATGKGT